MMELCYFTKSGNDHPDCKRCVQGMHSVSTGEHHCSRLGVNSLPGAERMRLAPAVNKLPPPHHPIPVVKEWTTPDFRSGRRVDSVPGRGYDRPEYRTFAGNFTDCLNRFEEGINILSAWGEIGLWSHKSKNYDIEIMSFTSKPVRDPLPSFITCFPRPA